MPHSDPYSRSVPVAAAVIERDRRFLLGRRPTAKRHGGLWEFPGGKLRPGESIEDAISRELREELGLELTRVGEVVYRTADPGSEYEICFVEVEAAGAARALEHSEVGWYGHREMAVLELAPADRRFVTAWMAGRDG